MDQLKERKAGITGALLGVAVVLSLAIAGLVYLKLSVSTSTGVTLDQVQDPLLFVLGLVILGLAGAGVVGFFLLEPNQARVLLLLGNYVGSVTEPGFYWVIPFLVQSTPISLRVRNFTSDRIKVNDAQGSPIEIASVVVWRVRDSAKALLNVDNFGSFVAIQSEAALRTLATRYSYDSWGSEYRSLRDDPEESAQILKEEIQARLEVAGVEVIEARITYLAYAPEIAQAMLRRQQALAIVAAKERLVEGALGMVEMALNGLSEKGLVQLDEDRKAAMVNNLLVALVAENGAQPILNTGTSDPDRLE